ncbi:protein-tyrosine phosphatase-like protein [Podospora australis]|uniref:Protein-tyrosine phosphatase-like protein n=1 Tax=Podospora australis TaxID=1536484 RepID=A0AAN6X3G9_9PEZI|nr:protein-tyrosine phosphatase-like protein [Podospora australis]
MAHLPRFRRRKEVLGPPLITNDLAGAGKTTPPPGELPAGDLPHPESPMRPFRKLSPFRVFNRSSAKRARDSPPASLPHSPAQAAATLREGVDGRPVSPLSLRMDTGSDRARGPPKMPAFLESTELEIENKFGELVWQERIRIQQGIENESSSNYTPDFRWARVKGPHLRKLDRYTNIQPWHNHRIKLQVPPGKLDYVNASPITLIPYPIPGQIREPDNYIAMQGPKQTSADHVWRMVVEQVESPGVIVMLTETHEGHMEKCFPYFPRSKDDPPLEVNQHDEFGDGFRATVRCDGLEETPAGDAIELRKLVITVHSRPRPAEDSVARESTPEPPSATELDADLDTKMKSPVAAPSTSRLDEATLSAPSPTTTTTTTTSQNNEPEERILWHFLYKKWPDFGVPALEDIDSFFTLMQLSREKNAGPHNPRIVHCSAGVGRSGTFIALEHLMRELDAGVLEHYDERVAASATSGTGGSRSRSRTPASTTSDTGSREGGEWSREASEAPPPLGEDLIFDTVNQLREQRKMMVQAEPQYQFIYQVLRKLWNDKYGAQLRGGELADAEADGEGNEEESSCGGREGEPAKKRVEVEFESSGGATLSADPFV